MTLNLALWIAVVLTAAASAALALARPLLPRPRGGIAAAAVLAAASALLTGVLFGADARILFEASPVAFYLAQAALPSLALILGGYLAARWYTWRAGSADVGTFAGIAGLAVAAGGCVLAAAPELNLALAAGVVAAMAGGFLVAGTRSPRAAGLALAVLLLWSAGFLVYLTVFPEQIAVAYEQPEDGGTPSEPTTYVIVAAAFVAAFALGFLSKRRG